MHTKKLNTKEDINRRIEEQKWCKVYKNKLQNGRRIFKNTYNCLRKIMEHRVAFFLSDFLYYFLCIFYKGLDFVYYENNSQAYINE